MAVHKVETDGNPNAFVAYYWLQKHQNIRSALAPHEPAVATRNKPSNAGA